MKVKKHALAGAIASLFCSGFSASAWAADVPTTGAYVTDSQNEYVQDQLGERVNTVNMIMCVIRSMRPDAMVNKGNYVALINQQKCDPSKKGEDTSSSTSAGATNTTQYIRSVVNATRQSSSSPMQVKAWLTDDQDDTTKLIYVQATINRSPSDAEPNGDFKVKFCGVPADSPNAPCTFIGSLSAGTASGQYGLQFVDKDSTTNDFTLMSIVGGTASSSGGFGKIMGRDNGQANDFMGTFAFNDGFYKRSSGRGNNQAAFCFSRRKTDADVSTWRYGGYNPDGSRHEVTNPGFPIKSTVDGKTYFGYAGFWGVFFPGDALANIKQANAVIEKSTPGSSSSVSYRLAAAPGRLYKMTRAAQTLDSIKGQSFQAFINEPVSYTGGANPICRGQYEMQWDGTQLMILRSAIQGSSGNSGCDSNFSSSSPAVLTAANLDAAKVKALQGFSQTVGGEISIPVPEMGEFSGSSSLFTRQRMIVKPGSLSANLNLACVDRCLKGGLSAQDFNGNNSSPFATISYQGFGPSATTVSRNSEFAAGPVGLSNVATYTFTAATGGLSKTDGTNTGEVDASTVRSNNDRDRFGVQTGKLIDVSAASYQQALCYKDGNGIFKAATQANPGTAVCPWLVQQVDEFYVFETGPNPWNQFIGLKDSNNTILSFDAPEQFQFTITPNNSTIKSNSRLNGSMAKLQYEGFGNLQGLPGRCVKGDSNDETDCGSQGSRFVPAVSLLDGTKLIREGDSAEIFVKYLDRELRFKKLNPGAPECSALDLAPAASLSLPSAPNATTDDPRTGELAVGAQPAFDQAAGVDASKVNPTPKVVDGVVAP